MKITNYIKRSHRVLLEIKETLFFDRINVYIKDPLPQDVSINNILKKIERLIPSRLASNIDIVYVGQFKDFVEREVNALYKDGALYISNDQDDENDAIDDIVHEIAHAAEEKYGSEIYGDDTLEREFLLKRKKLYQILKAYGYSVEYKKFMNPEYSEEFDELLYKEIGYEKLEHFTMNLFPSNYSVTSLREYYAIGFEHFFLGKRKELTKVSPVLYNKVVSIVEEEYDDQL